MRSSRKYGDVDLTSEIVSIAKSCYTNISSPTKTAVSERKITLVNASSSTGGDDRKHYFYIERVSQEH